MLVLVAALSLAAYGLAQTFEEKCSDLQLSIPDVQVNVLEFYQNGTNVTFPDYDPTCSPHSQIVYGGDICRVAMNVSTSAASHIILEAWLPSDWNGRFLSAGNGGLGGCIDYDIIAYANSYGFAAVGANSGHNGTSGRPFLNSPEVVEDFAYRSMHTGVVVGKELTKQFYEASINTSYYLGCSTGGRQGMKAAQAFPEDFDGIVAGAPAFDFNHLIDFSGWLSNVAGYDNTSDTFVTQSLWQAVNDAIIDQCDGLDGAIDGIIEDPDLCQPKLEGLLCGDQPANASTCLNSAQYDRVIKSMSPLYNASGTLIYPRLQPGAQAKAYRVYFAGQPFQYSSDWYKYVVYNDPLWDARQLGQKDFTLLDSLDPYNVSTWVGDLSPFASSGGKILTYHGLQDELISSENSARYYSHLASTMGLPPKEIDNFYRYFRISGMGHCQGGPGAWDIGQIYTGRAQGVSNPQNNVLEAIMAWVERDEAPEYIQGFTSGSQSADVQTKTFQRKHCRYPRRNVYNGTGDGADKAGWTCI